MHVAVVTVGDELLAGRTANTNATWLCERLHERGVSVERVATLPDRVADVARVVNEYHAEYDAVIVTGGLGPTHDDVTMAAIAAAFGTDLELHEGALEWLVEEGGYAREDLTPRTAHLPRGARPLHNEVGVAPGAVIGNAYVLPGVPREMEAMFESIADEFTGEPTYRVEVVVDEPESALLARLEALRERFEVTVGSYPGSAVRISIESTDEAEVTAAATWLEARVELAESDHEGDGTQE